MCQPQLLPTYPWAMNSMHDMGYVYPVAMHSGYIWKRPCQRVFLLVCFENLIFQNEPPIACTFTAIPCKQILNLGKRAGKTPAKLLLMLISSIAEWSLKCMNPIQTQVLAESATLVLVLAAFFAAWNYFFISCYFFLFCFPIIFPMLLFVSLRGQDVIETMKQTVVPSQ